ncbi:MAG: hypothetical protein ABS939_00330 [Psychrobacillus sp.]
MSTPKNVPAFILKKAKKRKSYVTKELAQARKRIDEKYHDFLLLLPQNEKLHDNGGYQVQGEAENLGIFSYDRGTFLSIEKPYVTVDGRVQMARDEHKEKEAMLNIHPPVFQQFGEIMIVSVTVESTLYGTATGTIEIGKSNAVDRSNPFANAQTSAIGRALGFLGYGLVGTGVIATAEEIEDAQVGDTTTTTTTPPPPTSNKAPIPFRVQLLETPKFGLDGSSVVKVLLESRQEAEMVLPKEQNTFAKPLKSGSVIIVKAWLNEEKMRLTVAKNTTPKIEAAS